MLRNSVRNRIEFHTKPESAVPHRRTVSAASLELEAADVLIVAAIARAGSVSGAARDLEQGQSVISRRLSAIEARLGVPLFRRTRSGVVLTASGSALLEESHAVVSQLERAAAAARDPLNRGDRELRVGVPVHAPVQIAMREVTHDLIASRPGLRVHSSALPFFQQWASVLGHELDVGFGMEDAPDAQLTATHLLRDTFSVLFLPDSHPLAGEPRVRIAEVTGIPIGIPDPKWAPITSANMKQALHSAGYRGRTEYFSEDFTGSWSEIATGMRVMIGSSASAGLRLPGVVAVPLDEPLTALDVYAYHLVDSPNPDAVALIEAMAAYIHEHAGHQELAGQGC
jgi:DNA-binding transcriptional LysR family regulator